MKQVWELTDKLKANHHHLVAIMERAEKAKKEKEKQGA